jgi:hypothetical protein
MKQNVWGKWRGIAVWSLCVAGIVAGCATSKPASISSTTQSGFLGDYSRLQPGSKEKDQALLRYLNPAAQWQQYTKVMIDPVTFWGDEKSKVKPADQKVLTTYFRASLEKQFGQFFQIVNVAGPGVMRVQVALTDLESSTPGLRTISLVVPQARMLNMVQSLATGKYVGAGAAQAEARLTDAATGQILGEMLDKRLGGSSASSAASWEWGDAEVIMDQWAEKAAARIHAWTTGAAVPGDPPPSK